MATENEVAETSTPKPTKKTKDGANKKGKGPMATAAKKKTGKKSAKKAPAKKVAAKKAETDGSSSRSMSVTIGQRLTPLMGKDKEISSIIKALVADDSVSHAKLVKLRDAVKEEASAKREAGKTSVASQLSAINGLVRRLERSAR